MKIAIIGPAHPLRPGGITTFNERLCKAFIDQGHEAEIWSFSLQYPALLFPGTSQFTANPPPENLIIHSVINSINPLNWNKVGNRIAQSNPDLVIVRYWLPFMAPSLGTILRKIKKNRFTKIICLADNIIPHEKRPGDDLLTRYFLAAPDAFVVMSKQVLADLEKLTPKPAILLPHPLYDTFGKPVSMAASREYLSAHKGLPTVPTDKILLFFGLIRVYKGLDLLLEAIPLIKTPNIKCLVAGEFYDNPNRYATWLNDPALAPKLLLFTHFVPNQEVPYFFGAADLIVQPYIHATQSGVTPLAYHFNKPMIVTNVGGLPEMVPHEVAGLVCEPTPISIAQAIDRFFELGDSFFQLGLAQEKAALGWDKFVQDLLGFSETLVPPRITD